MSANFYFIVDESGFVVGSQTTPGTIEDDNYVRVGPGDYNRFSSLGPYEKMQRVDGEFIIHPDPRPTIAVSSDITQVQSGGTVNLTFQHADDEVFSGKLFLEYVRPSGQGLLQVEFENGEAERSLVLTESGRHVFSEGEEWRSDTPLQIIVYD